MPIITPAYPSMCSTHNVTLSTQNIMTAEFKRGQFNFLPRIFGVLTFRRTAAEVVDKVIVGTTTWSELFAPHDFFSKYRYYLQITASSASAEVQLKWSVPPIPRATSPPHERSFSGPERSNRKSVNS